MNWRKTVPDHVKVECKNYNIHTCEYGIHAEMWINHFQSTMKMRVFLSLHHLPHTVLMQCDAVCARFKMCLLSQTRLEKVYVISVYIQSS